MQTEVIKVKGMTCMGCVNSVKNVLEKIPGVSSADVSLEQKQVTSPVRCCHNQSDQFKDAIKGPVLKSPASREPCHAPQTVVQPDKEALIKRLNRIEGQVRGVATKCIGRSLLR